MLVTPTPGTDPRDVLEVLSGQEALICECSDDLVGYLDWVLTTAEKLRTKIRPSDIDRLLFTPRMWRLQELVDRRDRSSIHVPTMTHPHDRFTTGLLSIELTEKAELFQRARTALEAEVQRWTPLPDPKCVVDPEVVVVDTSVFIQHPNKIREIDYAEVIGVSEGPIRLVVPRVAIDELDRLKESGNEKVRWRARHTLGVLDELLANPRSRVFLSDGSKTTVEVFFDDAHHVRLDDEDDEIIDRALALQAYTPEPVRLVTMDTSMALRARILGLEVHKPRREIGEEPPPDGSRSKKRARSDNRATAVANEIGTSTAQPG